MPFPSFQIFAKLVSLMNIISNSRLKFVEFVYN